MAENRSKTDKRLKNLKTDAGPGRPPGQKNYATLYREALIKLAEVNNTTPDDLELSILRKGIMNARSGDYRFYKDLLDRLHGQAESTNKVIFELTDEQKQRANSALRHLRGGSDTE